MKVLDRYRPAIAVIKLIIAIVAYFDRVHVWLDTDISKRAYAKLRQHCKVQRIERPMRYHREWCVKLEIFQPELEALLCLQDCIKGDYHINYVEASVDYIAASRRNAQAIRGFLDQHVIHASNGQYHYAIHDSHNTSYRGHQRNDRRIALYNCPRSKSKFAGTGPCAHLEMRVQGLPSVKKLDIYTLADLIYFDHRTFWSKHLRLRKVPSRAEVGRVYVQQVLGDTPQYSRRHYEKLFLKLTNKSAGSLSPVMVQQILSQVKALEPHLLVIPADSFLPPPTRKRPTRFGI